VLINVIAPADGVDHVGADPDPADVRTCPDVPAAPVSVNPVVILGVTSVGVVKDVELGKVVEPDSVVVPVTVRFCPTVTPPEVDKARFTVLDDGSCMLVVFNKAVIAYPFGYLALTA
jgi:hypothetical protein